MRGTRRWSLIGILAVMLGAGGCAAPGDPGAPPASRSAAADAAAELPNPVLVENRRTGDPTWRRAVRNSDITTAAAYADRGSVRPGEPVQLFVSTTAPTFRVTAYRMGWYGGTEARAVWRSERVPGGPQIGQGYVAATRTPFARWRPSLTVVTDGWEPGMYLLRVSAAGGAETLVPLVVRSPDARGRLVFLMSDLTWQAYNDWGGRSAYSGPGGFADRSRAVSFARPYANGHGTGKYLAYEHPVVVMAERLGVPVSYVTMSDLARDPTLVQEAEGVVSLGHAEYWPDAARAAVIAARDRGVDLAFLGANTAYWRVRVAPSGPGGLPLEDVYKSAVEDPGPQATQRFRDVAPRLAERTLVGLDYECFPATGTYTVADPSFFLFRAAGVRRGQTFAGLVDVEIDRAYPIAGTPANLQIVAHSPATCGGASTVSNSSYYTNEAGAGVFATGTMGWVLRALRGDAPVATTRFATRVTGRLLREMAAGPMGARYPARGNVNRFELGASNTTGAA